MKVYVNCTIANRITTTFIVDNGHKVCTRGYKEYFIALDTLKAIGVEFEATLNGEPSSVDGIGFAMLNK